MSSELKACPFCGADGGYQAATRIDHNRGAWMCHVCNARGPTADRPTMGSDAKPMEAWNRRTPSPAAMALVEACRNCWFDDEKQPERAIKEALAAVEREIGDQFADASKKVEGGSDAHRRTPSPAVMALVEAVRGIRRCNSAEAHWLLDEALAGVEREIGNA